jgi:hypothetical protein
MPKRYFDLCDDLHIPGRWALGTPVDPRGQESGSWLFVRGEPVQVEGLLRVPVLQRGKPLDFSLADAGAIPIVSEKVAEVLARIAPADVQLFPTKVGSHPEPYFLVNVARLVKCIDDKASREVRYWKPEDGRPEKVGKYRAVYGLRVDPAQVGDANVFRTWGWAITLAVSEEIKDALEGIGATGVKFEDVTSAH